MGVLEDGGAGDEGAGAGPDDSLGGVWSDAAIDLDFNASRTFVQHPSNTRDLGDGRLDEGLPAEAWIDGHDEHDIHVLQHLFDCGDGGGRIEGDAGKDAAVFDLADYSVEVLGGLHVDGYQIGLGVGERGDVAFWVFDHHVDVEECVGMRAERLDYRRPEG